MTAFDDGLWARLVDEHDADRVALALAPDHRSWRPWMVGLSGAAAAGVAAALAAVLLLAGQPGDAFAGWTAQPTTPSAAQLAAAKSYCASNVPMSGLPLKLTDTRGPFTFMVYSNSVSNDFCTVGPSFKNASGWTSSAPVIPPAGRLFLWTDHTESADGQPYTFMIAQAGDGVRGVKLTLDDGSVATATVENGWVVAWWPGVHHVAIAELATASGTQTQTFSYPCDVRSCDGGGSHGGAPGGRLGGG